MSWDRLRPLLLRAGVPSDFFDPLRNLLAEPAPSQRDATLHWLAGALRADGHAARLLPALVAAGDDARRIALDLAARLPALDGKLIELLRPLLRDRRLPARSRLEGAVALTRAIDPDQAATVRVLRDFAAGVGKSRALERAGALRRRFGHLPAFGPFLAYLRRKVKLRCPRCRAKLPRRAMVRHMWERHGALLVGRQVTTAWIVIDAWGGADAERGLLRLHRWMLRHGLSDTEACDHLRRTAARTGASQCPTCFALVPLPTDQHPDPAEPLPLQVPRGRLAAAGYVVEVSELGLYPRLYVATPRGIVADGYEPGGRLSHRAAVWLGVVPWLALAAILSLTTPPHLAPLLTTAALCAAFIFRVAVQLRPVPTTDPTDRAIDHAWTVLVPKMHSNGFDGADAAFLARLAVSSISRGNLKARDATVQRLVETTATALQSGRARVTDLAGLVRLSVADASPVAGDPVVRLATAIRPCLTGDASLALAELVLRDDLLAGWTTGQRARLRVLLLTLAFEGGLEVQDLHDIGRAAPALGRALGSDDLDGLARLRLLWGLRPSRPWHVCGPAATVFELANYPMLGGRHLEIASDLLLYQPLTGGGESGSASPLLVTGRGLLYREALIHQPETLIEVEEARDGFQLLIGRHRLACRGDPAELARKLRRWTAYFFKEFLPQTESVLGLRSADAGRLLRPVTVKCPKCRVEFLGRRGDVGGKV